jgi:UDP-glucose 4-epimerase
MGNILVTGGAGFIGSHVVDLLIGRGHAVHVIDDLSTGDKANVDKRAQLHVLDIRSKEIAPLLQKISPDSVVHLAAQIDVRRSIKEPAVDADINICGSLNLLTGALAAGTKHFVFASSAAVYGPPATLPLPEDSSLTPSSPYGIAKLAVEHYLRIFGQIFSIESAILRFANVYGPRQAAKGEAGAVAIFLKNILAGRPSVINGDGEQTRDFIYVGDVARMVAAAVDNKLAGVFNVSTGVETSVNRIHQLLSQAAASSISTEHGPAVPNEDRRCSLDPGRAAKAVGWRAEMSIEEGLRLTQEAFRQTAG